MDSSSTQNASYRSIQPAADGDRNSSPNPRKKRKTTAVACKACQRKRCKCDGGRPRCSACVASGVSVECEYETRSGQSRTEALREINDELQAENDRLRDLLDASGFRGQLPKRSGDMDIRKFMEEESRSDSPNDGDETSTRTAEQSHDYSAHESDAGHQNTPSFRAKSAAGRSSIVSADSPAYLNSKITQLESEFGALRAIIGQIQSDHSDTSLSFQGLPGPAPPLHFVPQDEKSRGEGSNSRPDGYELPKLTSAELLRKGRARITGQYNHKPQGFGTYLQAFGNLPFSSSIYANAYSESVQTDQLLSLSLPVYLVQMLNWEDHSSLETNVLSPEFASSTFHSFRTYCRDLIANGAPVLQVFGDGEIDVQQFFQAGNQLVVHTTTSFAPWFLGAYPSMTIPAKVAASVIMQALLRWQIFPSSEHYEMMPEWLRATGAQMFIPHLSAFDFLPWPQIRDLLINNGTLPEREILAMIISNLTIEWAGAVEEIFLWDQTTGLAVGVNPTFIAHVYDLGNWGINIKLLDKYPDLGGKANFVQLNTDLEVATLSSTEKR